jgi:hypothetical protein
MPSALPRAAPAPSHVEWLAAVPVEEAHVRGREGLRQDNPAVRDLHGAEAHERHVTVLEAGGGQEAALPCGSAGEVAAAHEQGNAPEQDVEGLCVCEEGSWGGFVGGRAGGWVGGWVEGGDVWGRGRGR